MSDGEHKVIEQLQKSLAEAEAAHQRLKADSDSWHDMWQETEPELARLRAENHEHRLSLDICQKELQRRDDELDREKLAHEKLEAAHQRLREALSSIANSACCVGCQEAALVARAALAFPETRAQGGA